MQLLLKPKKSLGQNFLIDKNIINKIIQIGDIDKNKTIMEIGSGYGNLTESISQMNPKKISPTHPQGTLQTQVKNEVWRSL